MPLRRAVAEDLPGEEREGPSHRPQVCRYVIGGRYVIGLWSWFGRGIALGVAPLPLRSSDSPLGGGGFAGRPESAGSRRSSPCRCAEASGPPIGLPQVCHW